METARNLVTSFSAKLLKLLPQVVRFQGENAPNSISVTRVRRPAASRTH